MKKRKKKMRKRSWWKRVKEENGRTVLLSNGLRKNLDK